MDEAYIHNPKDLSNSIKKKTNAKYCNEYHSIGFMNQTFSANYPPWVQKRTKNNKQTRK